MADGFEQMVDASRSFFAELAQNNTKEWFNPRKAEYAENIKKPAEFLGDLIAEDLARVTGQPHKPKLFRIYRDVRFSKDKTPLNTHLHLMWSRVDATALDPAWFFGLAQEYFILGVGIMGMQGETLTRFRAHIDSNGAALQRALEDGAANGVTLSDWGPPPLKNVPKPYDKDHPQAELLKRKALAVNVDIPGDWRQSGLVKAINMRITDLHPIAATMTPGSE